MTRLAVAVDRFAALLLGAALLAAGGLLIWSRTQNGAADGLPLQGLTDALGASWWPWAVAGAGVVLVLLGLRWLATHRRSPKAARIAFAHPAATGSRTADPGSVATAAAAALRTQPSVLKASARASVERGVPTITLTATTAAHQGLAAITAAADEVATTTARMIGDAVAVRTLLHVDAKQRRTVD